MNNDDIQNSKSYLVVTMNIEIVREEGFASIKRVVLDEDPHKGAFETPAPVYVPFPDLKRWEKDEKNVGIDHYRTISSIFPIVNISASSCFPIEDIEFKIFLAREDQQLDIPPQSKTLLMTRKDRFICPPGLIGNEGDEPAEFIKRVDPEKGTEPGVVAITNLNRALTNPRRLLALLHDLREKYANESLLYAAGAADPYNVPYLSYLGFDIFDTVKAARDAVRYRYWGHLGSIPLEKIGGIELSHCNCFGCEMLKKHMGPDKEAITSTLVEIETGELAELVRSLYFHNSLRLADAAWETRKAIENASLYLHAHGYAAKDPAAAAGLRLLYTEFSNELVMVTPRVSERTLVIAQSEMIDHPDVTAYQKRLKGSYIPPERDILLLLPCSYKKPYSLSKTHKKIGSVVRGSGLFSRIHRVVITSPLGVVPMELESTYPAKNYDIPVTGDWEERERKNVEALLEMMLDKGDYGYVVSHLGDENFLVNKILKERSQDTIFIEGKPTSEKALDELEKALSLIKQQIEPEAAGKKEISQKRQGTSFFRGSDVWGQLTFQFDEDIAGRLTKNSRLTGRWPSYSIKDSSSGEHIARFVPRRGMFSLGAGAASRLEGIRKNRVFIDDFHPKGTIFCVGIARADQNIRPMDEVLIYHDGELRGVGRSLVNGSAMTERNRGGGVKVRHRL